MNRIPSTVNAGKRMTTTAAGSSGWSNNVYLKPRPRCARKTLVVWAGMLTMVGFAGFVSSHEMTYATQSQEMGRTGGPDCGIGNNIFLNLSIGGVCFGSTPDQGWDNGNAGFTDPLTGLPAGSTDPQHLTPVGAESTSSLTIGNSGIVSTYGVYCQDLNDDLLCGADLFGDAETEPGGNPSAVCQSTHREGTMGCSFRSEPYVDFCETIMIFGGLSGELPVGSRRKSGVAPATVGSGDWADPTLDNWAIDFDAFVFLPSPTSGNPPSFVMERLPGGQFLNPCGPGGYGTSGVVSHEN